MRTIIEIPDTQLDALDAVCRSEGISRAEAIRQAIAVMLRGRSQTVGGQAFGLWRSRPVDSLAYQRRLRDEWEARPDSPARTPRAARRRRS
jgi:hypothetical protein